jgi:hypothetical protein
MSKEEQEEPDYKSQIKKRAQQSSGLRQHAVEKAKPIWKVESNPQKRNLQQEVELAKEKRKSATG